MPARKTEHKIRFSLAASESVVLNFLHWSKLIMPLHAKLIF